MMRTRLVMVLVGCALVAGLTGPVGPAVPDAGAEGARATSGSAALPQQQPPPAAVPSPGLEDPAAGQASVPVPQPKSIQIVTVPYLRGATFTFDGKRYVTGVDGTVSIETHELRDLTERVRFDSVTTDPDVRVSFVRLATLSHSETSRRVFAVFDVERAVRFSFANSGGDAVPGYQVTSMKLRSSTGEERVLSSTDLERPFLLPAVRVVPGLDEPEPTDIRYTVQEVIVDGTNTVNRSQQEFFPSRVGAVTVQTMFFTVEADVRDAFFGYTDADAVLIRWPDGSETRHPVSGGRAKLPPLPRGDYQMRVDGFGLKVWQPIAVSRDQHIQLKLLSALDVGAVLVALLGAASVLLAIGRRRARSLRKERAKVVQRPAQRRRVARSPLTNRVRGDALPLGSKQRERVQEAEPERVQEFSS